MVEGQQTNKEIFSFRCSVWFVFPYSCPYIIIRLDWSYKKSKYLDFTLWPFPLQHLTSRAKPCLNGMHLSPRCQTLPLLNAANPPEQKKSYAAQNLEASGHNQDQKRNVFLWDAIMCICSTKSLSFLTQRRSSSVEMFFLLHWNYMQCKTLRLLSKSTITSSSF